jgi:predicted lipoprotein with Yx(FWY)xxD motif
MSRSPSWRAGVAALLLVTPLALSACATSGTGVPASLAVPVGNGAPIGASSANASPDGISTTDTFVGTVMTSDGFTLYRYTKDRATPPTSTCTGRCAASWSPIAADQTPIPFSVDPTLLGSVVRPDGSKQLTVAGWPVYRYIKDTAPGYVNGQGVDGLWQAIDADGKPLATAATPPGPAEPAKGAPAPAPAPVKAPVVAPKPVAPGPAAAAPKVVNKAPVAPPTTVVRDAPGTSSTD